MRLRSKPTVRRVSRGRRVTAAAVSFVVMTATFVMALGASPASAAPACRIDYSVNDWGGGFTANVTVNNLGDPITNWTLTFSWAGSQRITNGWNATWNQPQGSANVTATSASYNGSIGTGGSTTVGFQGTYSGTNTAPTSFSLNGTACTGQPPTTDPPPDN